MDVARRPHYDRRTFRRSVLALTFAAAVALPGPARAADVRYFHISVKVGGELFVDYFEDRRKPGLTTAAGVDGTEARVWSWEVRAVAKSVRGGALESTAAISRAKTVFRSTVVAYTILMGDLEETPLGCRGGTWTSWDGRGAGPPPAGDFVRHRYPVSLDSKLLAYLPALQASAVDCGYHPMFSVYEGHDDLPFPFYANEPGHVRVSRRVFDPRVHRSFRRTYRVEPPVLRPDHGDVVDPNQLHTVSITSQLTLAVNAISEQTWRARHRAYAGRPKGRWSIARR